MAKSSKEAGKQARKRKQGITDKLRELEVPPEQFPALRKLRALYEARGRLIASFFPGVDHVHVQARPAESTLEARENFGPGRRFIPAILSHDRPALSFMVSAGLFLNNDESTPPAEQVGAEVAKWAEDLGFALIEGALELRRDIEAHPKRWKSLPTLADFLARKGGGK